MRLLIYFILLLLLLLGGCAEKMALPETVKVGSVIDSVSSVDDTGIFAIVSAGKIELLSTRKGLQLYKKINIGDISVNNIFCSIESCWVGGGTHQEGILAKIDISEESIKRIKQHDRQYSEIYFITSSVKQGIIITGHSNGEIIAWDEKQNKELLKFGDYASEVFALAVSRDGGRLYSGKGVNGIDLWDIGTGKLIKSNKETEGSIFTIKTNKNTKSIICGGSQGILYFIDDNKLSIIKKIIITDGAIFSCDVRGRDGEIVCGLSDGYISVANFNKLSSNVYKVHNDNVIYVKFIDEGDRILSVSKDGTAKIWNVTIIQ
jgi:WD40 repeat protein